MLANKITHIATYLFLVLFFLTTMFNSSLADKLRCEKGVEIYAPDPSEYHQRTDEDALGIQLLGDEGNLLHH